MGKSVTVAIDCGGTAILVKSSDIVSTSIRITVITAAATGVMRILVPSSGDLLGTEYQPSKAQADTAIKAITIIHCMHTSL
jgi:hypothetical protein